MTNGTNIVSMHSKPETKICCSNCAQKGKILFAGFNPNHEFSTSLKGSSKQKIQQQALKDNSRQQIAVDNNIASKSVLNPEISDKFELFVLWVSNLPKILHSISHDINLFSQLCNLATRCRTIYSTWTTCSRMLVHIYLQNLAK